jgi:hypothetical protein
MSEQEGSPVEGQPLEGGGEGMLSNEQQTFAGGKFNNVADLEKSYMELQSKLGQQAPAPAQQQQAPAQQPPAQHSGQGTAADQIAEFDRLQKENMQYKQQQRQNDINSKLGLDYDTDQWRKVADFANKTKNPKQIAAIEAAIEAGMYESVKSLVDDFNNQSHEQGTETPSPASPTTSNHGGSAGFATADEARKFLRESRNLAKAGTGTIWMQKLMATPDRIRNELGSKQDQAPPSFG